MQDFGLTEMVEDLRKEALKQFHTKGNKKIPLSCWEVLEKVFPEGSRPLMVKEFKIDNNSWEIVINLPANLKYIDFADKVEYFSDHVGGSATIERFGQKAKLWLSDLKLEKEYAFKFDPHQFKDMFLPVVVGHGYKGLVFEDMTKFPHLFVAGNTNSGKSNFLLGLIYGLLLSAKYNPLSQVFIIVVDFMRKDFGHLKDHVLLVQDPDDVPEILNKILQVIRSRSDIIDKTNARNWKNLLTKKGYDPYENPFIVLVIDEMGEMQSKEEQLALKRICATCRAFGINVVGASQRPSTDMWSATKFKDVLMLFDGRIAFRVPDADSSAVILGKGYGQASHLPEFPGRGIYKWGSKLQEFQGMFFPEDDDKVERLMRELDDTPRKIIKWRNEYGNSINIDKQSPITFLPRQTNYQTIGGQKVLEHRANSSFGIQKGK